jgi:transposase
VENINLLAIDVAKNIFQLHGVNKQGKCTLKKRLGRESLLAFIVKLPICTIVMEACGSTFYWAREFEKLGHIVKLISPQYVKPYVKGNKTDGNDAEAIAEAASRPNMRYVPIKTTDQQDIQSIHRIRERVIQQQVALCNQTRGLLAEYGIVFRQGKSAFRKMLPIVLENKENKLNTIMLVHIQKLYEEFTMLEEKINFYDKELIRIYKGSELAKKIGEIEGVGPVTATAILALGNLNMFKNGRHFAAFLGLVPREYSSGNKQRLLGISKRGDSYLRTLLVHGARSVIYQVNRKTDVKSRWLQQLLKRRGMNRACCALANKTARIIWAVITSDQRYDKNKACFLCGDIRAA